MAEQFDYTIHTDVKVGPLKLIDIPRLAKDVKDHWFNQSLCEVNDCVVRIGVFKKGNFHWHKHDNEDEFFFVVDGQFVIELKDKTVTLNRNQGFMVPRGVLHFPHVPDHATVLMFEGRGVVPTGD